MLRSARRWRTRATCTSASMEGTAVWFGEGFGYRCGRRENCKRTTCNRMRKGSGGWGRMRVFKTKRIYVRIDLFTERSTESLGRSWQKQLGNWFGAAWRWTWTNAGFAIWNNFVLQQLWWEQGVSPLLCIPSINLIFFLKRWKRYKIFQTKRLQIMFSCVVLA